jgi:cytochrome P450
MATTAMPMVGAGKRPINFTSKAFNMNKYAYYAWLREHAPVYRGKFAILNVYFVSRYDDCVRLLKDPRFVRNRSNVTGGSKIPFPVPKAVKLVAENMLLEDEPEHRRLRTLVHKAFTPRALARLETRIERLTQELLDDLQPQGTVDLQRGYALPIPVTVIKEMVGVEDQDMPRFLDALRVMNEGFTARSFIMTLVRDLPRLTAFVRELIARKRTRPGDDILTGLLQAEEGGDRLSEDELIGMVYLLIMAGFETTIHLITNSVATLLLHPDQLARLREQPDLIESAVEEVLRFNGPVHSTKMHYASEDVTIEGVTIPKGSPVMALLASANRDPAAFPNPDVFDIARTPNKHLGFGQGIHYCLGAPLARIETRIALQSLLDRNPNLRLAVEPSELRLQNIPMWHRYERLPVILG